jgi:hypothetical protein
MNRDRANLIRAFLYGITGAGLYLMDERREEPTEKVASYPMRHRGDDGESEGFEGQETMLVNRAMRLR